MNTFEGELQARLAQIQAQGLFRELRPVDSAQGTRVVQAGRDLLNFSSNDYLGLANEPALKQAAIVALRRYGAGSGASRLVCGSLAPHHLLEEAIAAFKNTPAAIAYSSGYAAALGALCALTGPQDVLILDRLVHASIVDAARLSGATLRVFAHNNLDQLESLLRWARRKVDTGGTRSRGANILVVTESVFSMDGDVAPLLHIVELKDKHGAWLMLDEAHATGLYGAQGRGLADHFGVADGVEIQMGTLGKAIGAAGGFICGSRTLIDYLVNRSRSFIFSTAPPPATAAAAAAGIAYVQTPEGEQRRGQLWERVRQFQMLASLPVRGEALPVAIHPWLIGEEKEALKAAEALRNQGIFVPAIRHPAVPRGKARLRITLTARHSPSDVASLGRALVHADSKNCSCTDMSVRLSAASCCPISGPHEDASAR